jgi:hypothetical protein
MRVSLGLGTKVFILLAMMSVALAADDVGVSGKWSGTWTTGGRFSGPCTLEFVQKGGELTGELYVANRPAPPPSYTAPLKGSVKGETVEFSYTSPDLQTRYTVSFAGKVSGNALTGTASGGGRDTTFAVKRGQ